MPLKHTDLTRRGDFEVHVGFSREEIPLAERLSPSAAWRKSYVQEVVTPLLARGMYEGHDVPGHLGLLASKRHTNYADALKEVDLVAKTFQGFSHIRIELEEVLLTHVGAGVLQPPSSPDYEPTDSDLVHGLLIADTPRFEIHFGFYSGGSDTPLNVTTRDLVDQLTKANVPIHEAVRFSSKPKITTTTFFSTIAEIREDCVPIATRVLAAIDEPGITVKTAAERIILCAKPRSS